MNPTLSTQVFTIQNPTGFHARPARTFAELAGTFPGSIRVKRGTKSVNGKSPLAMLTLGAKHLDEVTIEAEGENAAAAVEQLGAILTQVFVE